MSDKFFGIKSIDYEKWKGRTYYVCKSGYQLWIAFECMNRQDWAYRGTTREEYKAVIKKIPYPPHPTCRCKDCRYHRLIKKYES